MGAGRGRGQVGAKLQHFRGDGAGAGAGKDPEVPQRALAVGAHRGGADGGVVQQIARGVSGVEEGSPQAAWGRPKKKEK